MNSVYKAVKISNHVYWVGAIDWNIRDFHGYTTRRGTTYNAYLVLSDNITLIDTVREPFRDEMLSRIASVINPENIRFIVSNHSEMDHTGCLAAVMEIVKPDEVYASVIGAKTLREMYSMDRVVPVKDKSTLDLGNMTLSFLETRMLHWPDSMFSYVDEDKVLFSHDAFGMHLASSERFADEIDRSILDYEGATYFANILLPYAQLVLKLIEKVDKLGYKFKIVAPDHGPVWRKNIKRVIELYSSWALQMPLKKAVVVYATMWHSTELMARAISEGLAHSGVDVKLMSMAENHRSDVAYEVLDAGALIVGSPTLNNNVFPSIADVLTYLKGLRPMNLIGAAFGSYGWSGESIRQVEDVLKEMKVELVGEAVGTKHVPDSTVLDQCFSLGKMIGEQLDKRTIAT
ncbi:MAG: FprA family A-type flavoprotein [Deltaproteobacteria bacterium]|nr:FprA family A-type flavoprotein [Deltaproteobacteria bacterium]